MTPTHFVSVAALVTNDKGEILLVKSPWRGWEYPGGLIEPGETFESALHREVFEEAGVEIEITGFVGICKNVERDIVNIDFTFFLYTIAHSTRYLFEIECYYEYWYLRNKQRPLVIKKIIKDTDDK